MGQMDALKGKRAELFEAGVMAGYPELVYRDAERIQAGRREWLRFCMVVSHARIEDALRAAETLE